MRDSDGLGRKCLQSRAVRVLLDHIEAQRPVFFTLALYTSVAILHLNT